jgi:hypothetical protein
VLCATDIVRQPPPQIASCLPKHVPFCVHALDVEPNAVVDVQVSLKLAKLSKQRSPLSIPTKCCVLLASRMAGWSVFSAVHGPLSSSSRCAKSATS